MSDGDNQASNGPPYPVVAYCAPGLREYAARLLETRGEHYTQLTEHAYLAGQTDVILTTDPHWTPTVEDITAVLR